MYHEGHHAILTARLDLRREDDVRVYEYLNAASSRRQSREAIKLMLLGLEAKAAGAVPGKAGTPVQGGSEEALEAPRTAAAGWNGSGLDTPGDWSVEFGTPEEMAKMRQALSGHEKPTATLTAENEPDSGELSADDLPEESTCGRSCPYRARIEALEERCQSCKPLLPREQATRGGI